MEREELENVFITALEGGSNYWCYLSSDAISLIRKAVPKEDDRYLASAMLKAILDHDVEVPINDVEDTEDILGYMTRDNIQHRLEKLYEDDAYNYVLSVELDGFGDADTSDIIFQYLLFGDVVYG